MRELGQVRGCVAHWHSLAHYNFQEDQTQNNSLAHSGSPTLLAPTEITVVQWLKRFDQEYGKLRFQALLVNETSWATLAQLPSLRLLVERLFLYCVFFFTMSSLRGKNSVADDVILPHLSDERPTAKLKVVALPMGNLTSL